MTRIAVVDYGMGNLRSVSKALEHVAPNARVEVTSDAKAIHSADRVVFPGQGAMPDCMRELDARGLRQTLVDVAASKPFLGICMGLQMLFGESEEGNVSGIDVFHGPVRRFREADMDNGDGLRLKVPHMGWNQVIQRPHALWQGIENESRFYFVHSYVVEPEAEGIMTAETVYGRLFTSAVARDNIFAVQFHPEKSHDCGLRLLANFASWNP